MAKLVMESAPREMKKMKRLVMILLMGLFCMSNMSYAGNGDLTVGGTLEMTGSANGFLPPRMTTSARGNLSPSPGMLIYNTDDNSYNYYTSSGWKTLGPSLPIHDNTGASSDYNLVVGETARRTFTNATSVPLYISTQEGLYEITIQGDKTVTPVNGSGVFLNPNNTTYTNAFTRLQTSYGTVIGFNTTNVTDSGILIGAGRTLLSTVKVSTNTHGKASGATDLSESPTQKNCYTIFTGWNDTSTAWTSLGTIVFPFAQSGTVIIRRIL